MMETEHNNENHRDRKSARRAGPFSSHGPTDDFETLSRDELYERAKSLNVPGRSRMTRIELINAIRKSYVR